VMKLHRCSSMMMNRLRESERRTRERIRGSGERKIMNNEKSEGGGVFIRPRIPCATPHSITTP
jgi:hypothetical protein